MFLIYIPSRGGSKGIPRKNMHTFLGKPLIYQTLKIAKQIEDCYKGRVINFLSSDEDDIIDVELNKIILATRDNDRADFMPVKIEGRNVHVMNKFALTNHLEKIMETYAGE